jgi:hypothetical protein
VIAPEALSITAVRNFGYGQKEFLVLKYRRIQEIARMDTAPFFRFAGFVASPTQTDFERVLFYQGVVKKREKASSRFLRSFVFVRVEIRIE